MQFPENNPLFHISTKLSGNLRFIHLMTHAQKVDERKRRAEALGKTKSAYQHNDHEPEETLDFDESEDEDRQIDEALQKLGEDDEISEEEDSDHEDTLTSESSIDSRDSDGDVSNDRGLKKRERKVASAFNDPSFEGLTTMNQDLLKLLQFVSLKGVGISLVNSDPKEIIYLSLYDISILMYTVRNFVSNLLIENNEAGSDGAGASEAGLPNNELPDRQHDHALLPRDHRSS